MHHRLYVPVSLSFYLLKVWYFLELTLFPQRTDLRAHARILPLSTDRWDRADVREIFINYGDACLRALPLSAANQEEHYHQPPLASHHTSWSLLSTAEMEANAAYALAAAAGLFAHPMQRPVHEVRHPRTGKSLEARAVWAKNEASRKLLRAQLSRRDVDDDDEFAQETLASTSGKQYGTENVNDGHNEDESFKEASKKVDVYLRALESHWEVLRNEAQSLLRKPTAAQGGGEATKDLGAPKSSTATSSFAARCMSALQRWLFPSQGPSHAGFAPANDMLLHANSGFLSNVW